MGLAVRNRKSSPKSYYSCEWSNGYSFFIGFLYRVIPADGVCLPCAFLTDGRLLRLILLFVLVRIPFEKIKLRPLVVGTDEGGLSHPDWQENLANALKIQTLLNRSAPGLCRNLNLRTERFNQHETPGSLLVEVGASGNTLAEALRSARILGQALAVFLRGQMHDDTD